MALGAEPGDVLKLVLLATGKILAVGLFVGLALSILASRLLAERMQGMGTADPALFVVVPLVLIVATFAACFLPARSLPGYSRWKLCGRIEEAACRPALAAASSGNRVLIGDSELFRGGTIRPISITCGPNPRNGDLRMAMALGLSIA
jgi:hypothetical protein